MVKIFTVILVISYSLILLAEESGRAIMDSNPEKGIVLSDLARKNIGLKTMTLSHSGVHSIPTSGLVFSRDKTGIYLLRDNWLKFIPVQIVAKHSSTFDIASKELPGGSVIVVEGAALVRVSEMEAFAGEE